MPLQCSITTKLPRMFVSSFITNLRHSWFQSHQLVALNTTTANGESYIFNYKKESFLNFLKDVLKTSTYLRVYLASYQQKLTLIYAIWASDGPPKEERYFIYEKDDFVKISFSFASQMAAEYVSLKAPKIVESTGVAKATRAVKISKEALVEFIYEIEAQNPSSIKAQLSSYTDTETASILKSYHKMVFIDFIFRTLDEQNREADASIEDCPNFDQREHWLYGKDASFRASLNGFNNTTLCPPGIDCEKDLTLP